MRSKHYAKREKVKRTKASKLLLTIIIIVFIVAISIVGVMANTVSCTVVDGDEEYTFTMMAPDSEEMIDKAIEMGMPEILSDDKIEHGDNSVNIYRSCVLTISKGEELISLETNENEVIKDVLDANNVDYSDWITATPEIESIISGNMEVQVKDHYLVTINYNDETVELKFYEGTVGDALITAEIEVDANDYISASKNSEISSDMVINVSERNEITIDNSGISKEYLVYGTTVSEVLEEVEITLEEGQKVLQGLDEEITEGYKIDIQEVTEEKVVKTETIEYETVYENSSTLEQGKTEVKQNGVNGTAEVTYIETFVNGESQGLEESSRKVTKEPVDKIVLKGTKVVATPEEDPKEDPKDDDTSSETETPSGNTFVDYNGKTVSYSKVLTGSGTAYYIPGGTTSIGWAVKKGIVAVNPNIIPYKTNLYIEAPGLTYGYGIAADTGGALMAGTALVDVYYESLEECYTFGRRNCTVYLLD